MIQQDPSPSPDRVVSPPARDPLVRLLIVAAMLLGFAIWTIYDHYMQGNYQDGAELNTHLKYLFNHYVPFVLIPPGLVALFLAFRAATRRAIADAQGVGFSNGMKMTWGQVRKVDSRLLQTKGILDLYDAAGKRMRLDWWYLTNFRDLVAFVDSHLPTDVEDMK